MGKAADLIAGAKTAATQMLLKTLSSRPKRRFSREILKRL
jgi:hypothetical protein